MTTTPFLVADRYTIADIALYAYTHVADEGGFDLAGYPGGEGLARPGGGPAGACADYRRFLRRRSVRQPDFQGVFPGFRIVVGEVEQAELLGVVPPSIELSEHFRQSSGGFPVGREEEANAAG